MTGDKVKDVEDFLAKWRRLQRIMHREQMKDAPGSEYIQYFQRMTEIAGGDPMAVASLARHFDNFEVIGSAVADLNLAIAAAPVVETIPQTKAIQMKRI